MLLMNKVLDTLEQEVNKISAKAIILKSKILKVFIAGSGI